MWRATPKTLATATVDRLLHHAHVVLTEGGSHRLAEATSGKAVTPLTLKGARYALWRNPEDLTARQHAKLADIAATNRRLYRAYLLN
jgi:hypothetical protein